MCTERQHHCTEMRRCPRTCRRYNTDTPTLVSSVTPGLQGLEPWACVAIAGRGWAIPGAVVPCRSHVFRLFKFFSPKSQSGYCIIPAGPIPIPGTRSSEERHPVTFQFFYFSLAFDPTQSQPSHFTQTTLQPMQCNACSATLWLNLQTSEQMWLRCSFSIWCFIAK